MPDFLAIDGEAIPDRYNLLCASDGRHVLNMDELTTCECLDFLLSLYARKRVIVCFGLNYDINMWLRDLDRPALEHLWQTGECVYVPRGKVAVPDDWYKLSWIPGHRFEIQRIGHPRVRIYEVWGFFQSSFVNALRAWKIGEDGELSRMEATKAERGTFTSVERTLDYCRTEVGYLVELMHSLAAACHEAGCVPREWMGAGSLAARLLADHEGLQEHHKHDNELGDDGTVDAILRAYFGGRIELLRQGVFQRVQALDIRSAYPDAITFLPSLRGASLRRVARYDSSLPHALWHVSWNGLHGSLMPFPVRKDKDVYYPVSGSGWYHACEVHLALVLGYDVQVTGGLVLTCASFDSPFHWVPELYKLRERWKREGRAAEKILKLGLNSLYGKLAQGIGFHGRLPRWQSYFWAGEITARTRARMLSAAYLNRDSAIMLATDGLFHTAGPMAETAGLGGWESRMYDEMFAARAGVYVCENGKDRLVKSRGFYAREVDFDALREAYEREGPLGRYTYPARRFIGIGTALMRKNFNVWRTWEDSERVVSLMPLAKRVMEDGRLLPYDGELPESEPYKPKTAILSDEDAMLAMEQPDKE